MEDHIKHWVSALRSGNYKQVQGTLKGKNQGGEVGFCCLGVYARINGRSIRTEPWGTDYEGSEKHYDWLRNAIKGSVYEKGMKMNDEGYSFSEIADMIEEQYEGEL